MVFCYASPARLIMKAGRWGEMKERLDQNSLKSEEQVGIRWDTVKVKSNTGKGTMKVYTMKSES